MRRIIVSEFMSLDGVIENPVWTVPFWSDEIAEFKASEQVATDSLLLGRVTYDGFSKAWPESKDKGAEQMNNMPKYVVSTTLQTAEWNNSRIIKENIFDEIRKLKEEDGKDILMYGSGKLINSLIKENLVDQFNILIYPIVLGKGQKLFEDGNETKLKLIESKSFDTGVILARYESIKINF